jgi:hypothetical protein
VTYEGLHGRWRMANSGECGAAWTAWNVRDKKGDGALHIGVVLRMKQTTTGRHGGTGRRRRLQAALREQRQDSLAHLGPATTVNGATAEKLLTAPRAREWRGAGCGKGRSRGSASA